MSCAKQLPRTRSFSVVVSGAQVPLPDGSGECRSSRKAVPRIVLWLSLETLGRFTGEVACTIAELLLAGLSWLLSEFLAGCAAYAEAMHPTSIATGHGDNSSDQARPAPAATGPRLVVVSDFSRDIPEDGLPLREPEIVHCAGAPNARRNSRPR